MSNDLDQVVRRIDEDRWLASRFASADVRARLIALYAFNYEVARTAEVVTQPTMGDIRLAWWREAIGEIYAGKPLRAHPVVEALAVLRAIWPQEALEALIEGRARDLDAAPFASWDELDAYHDATAGQVMRLALTACGIDAGAHAPFVQSAGRAWGRLGFARARRDAPRGETQAALLERASAAYEEARKLARGLPSAAFPAFGYVALAPFYLRALKSRRSPPLLFTRQLRLVAAAATGRV